MEIRKMKLSELTPAEYNPRVELKPGDQEWEALDESIDSFGYVEPIVWNERTGNIVGGHQRRNVLLARGVEEEDISVVNLSPEDEKILNVLLNKSKGIWDVAKLVALIDEITASGVMIGLNRYGKKVRNVHLVATAPDRRESIHRTLREHGADRDFIYHDLFHTEGFAYEKPATAVWGGITLHPNYEAKTMQWFVKSGLDPGSTLFWIVGAAPRNIPAAGRP